MEVLVEKVLKAIENADDGSFARNLGAFLGPRLGPGFASGAVLGVSREGARRAPPRASNLLEVEKVVAEILYAEREKGGDEWESFKEKFPQALGLGLGERYGPHFANGAVLGYGGLAGGIWSLWKARPENSFDKAEARWSKNYEGE